VSLRIPNPVPIIPSSGTGNRGLPLAHYTFANIHKENLLAISELSLDVGPHKRMHGMEFRVAGNTNPMIGQNPKKIIGLRLIFLI
jgi:hypothetical protein